MTSTQLSLPLDTGGAVFRRNGVPMTTSKAIADHFGKAHKNVLRDIDRLIAMDPNLRLSFEPEMIAVPTGKGGTRYVRGFTINQRAFALLVMGFTGAEALRWKQAFLDAFDRLAERERDNRGFAMEQLRSLGRRSGTSRPKRRIRHCTDY